MSHSVILGSDHTRQCPRAQCYNMTWARIVGSCCASLSPARARKERSLTKAFLTRAVRCRRRAKCGWSWGCSSGWRGPKGPPYHARLRRPLSKVRVRRALSPDSCEGGIRMAQFSGNAPATSSYSMSNNMWGCHRALMVTYAIVSANS